MGEREGEKEGEKEGERECSGRNVEADKQGGPLSRGSSCSHLKEVLLSRRVPLSRRIS